MRSLLFVCIVWAASGLERVTSPSMGSCCRSINQFESTDPWRSDLIKHAEKLYVGRHGDTVISNRIVILRRKTNVLNNDVYYGLWAEYNCLNKIQMNADIQCQCQNVNGRSQTLWRFIHGFTISQGRCFGPHLIISLKSPGGQWVKAFTPRFHFQSRVARCSPFGQRRVWLVSMPQVGSPQCWQRSPWVPVVVR